MKVILKQAIAKLGQKGEIKEVNGGYARNFLIPRGEAIIATKTSVKELEKNQVVKEKAGEKDKKKRKVKKKVKKVKKSKKK